MILTSTFPLNSVINIIKTSYLSQMNPKIFVILTILNLPTELPQKIGPGRSSFFDKLIGHKQTYKQSIKLEYFKIQ